MISTIQTRITASSIFLIFQIGIYQVALYNFSCPLHGNWMFRAEVYCNSTLKYFCLFNNAEGEYVEGCGGPDWDRKGSKRVFSLYFTRGNCSVNRYQPMIFQTNKRMSDCVFAKSICNEEGQILYQADSSKKDRTCRCDYAKNYAFTKIPKNLCYCIPSEEDCSCYIRSCPVNHTLSTDYECVQSGYQENTKCEAYNKQNKTVEENKPVKNEMTTRLKQRQIRAVYVLCIISLLLVIVGGKFLICFHRIKTGVLRRNEIQFLRMIYLLYRVACPVVRMKFNNEIKPYQLGKTLDENKLNIKEKYRDNGTIINDHQWDLLYNHDKGRSVKSEYFDLGLMMRLLRCIVNIKICDVYPELSDESVSALLSRIKYIRNKVAKTFGADLSKDELNQHWDDMRQALRILVRKLDIQNEQEDTGIVDNLKLKIKQIPLSRHLDHVLVYNTFTDLTAEEHNFLLVFYVIAKIVYPVIKDEFEKKCTETQNSSTRTESRNLLKTMISELKEKAVEEGNTDYCIQLDVINDIQRQIVQSSSGTLTEIEMQDILKNTEKAVLHFEGKWNEEKISHLQKMENILNQ